MVQHHTISYKPIVWKYLEAFLAEVSFLPHLVYICIFYCESQPGREQRALTLNQISLDARLYFVTFWLCDIGKINRLSEPRVLLSRQMWITVPMSPGCCEI